jgi:hypothetical protein
MTLFSIVGPVAAGNANASTITVGKTAAVTVLEHAPATS